VIGSYEKRSCVCIHLDLYPTQGSLVYWQRHVADTQHATVLSALSRFMSVSTQLILLKPFSHFNFLLSPRITATLQIDEMDSYSDLSQEEVVVLLLKEKAAHTKTKQNLAEERDTNDRLRDEVASLEYNRSNAITFFDKVSHSRAAFVTPSVNSVEGLQGQVLSLRGSAEFAQGKVVEASQKFETLTLRNDKLAAERNALYLLAHGRVHPDVVAADSTAVLRKKLRDRQQSNVASTTEQHFHPGSQSAHYNDMRDNRQYSRSSHRI
jgi:hypothetical protein